MAEEDRSGKYDEFVKGLKKHLGIDTRYSVLDYRAGKSFLQIYTDSISRAVDISRYYRKESSGLRIKVVLLPDKTVGAGLKGICHVGVCPVRSASHSSSEQVTQVLFGESFDALQVYDGWIRVRLHADGYVGWVSENQVSLFDETGFSEYESLPKVFVTDKVVDLLSKPEVRSGHVREAVFGSPLSMDGIAGRFFRLRLPDGNTAFVGKSSVSRTSPVRDFSLKGLIEVAQTFQGTSYVWGGRSAKGFDCSGFVQTVFRYNGIELPRDSSVQFSSGKFLGKDFRDFKGGDLLFFSYDGKEISHVALYIGGNRRFIHSSGYVRTNSLDPKSRDYSEKLSASFVGACRVTQ